MRSSAIVCLTTFFCAGSLGGCSFIDDFDRFHARRAAESRDDGGSMAIDAGAEADADAQADDASGTDGASSAQDSAQPSVDDASGGNDGSAGPSDAGAADANTTGVCGDGVIDTGRGETCDDRNQVSGDGCEPGTCTATPSPTCGGKLCSDGDPCTLDSCDSQTQACTFPVIDADSDGYSPGACRADSAHMGGDCNDGNAAIAPNAPEICDGIDNNCDSRREIDEGLVQLRCYPDLDGDGYPNLDGVGISACACAAGQIAVAQDRTKHDCYDDPDGGSDVHPGQITAFERGYGRNGVRSFDYDCDGDQQPRYKALPAGGCQGLLLLCVGESGFDGMAPACGESGRFSVCTALDVGCGGSSETRKQLCN
jgi:cysteine-rich repeat protein